MDPIVDSDRTHTSRGPMSSTAAGRTRNIEHAQTNMLLSMYTAALVAVAVALARRLAADRRCVDPIADSDRPHTSSGPMTLVDHYQPSFMHRQAAVQRQQNR